MWAVAVDDDQVGALARLDRANLAAEAERLRAARAWPSSARRAPSARRGPRVIACSPAASRISVNMSRWLLQAAPSAPSETEMPRARISATGAMPDASFRFEPGQCRTLTCAIREQLLLRVVHPHAMREAQAWRRQPEAIEIGDVRHAGSLAHERDLVAILRRMRVHEQPALA